MTKENRDIYTWGRAGSRRRGAHLVGALRGVRACGRARTNAKDTGATTVDRERRESKLRHSHRERLRGIIKLEKASYSIRGRRVVYRRLPYFKLQNRRRNETSQRGTTGRGAFTRPGILGRATACTAEPAGGRAWGAGPPSPMAAGTPREPPMPLTSAAAL